MIAGEVWDENSARMLTESLFRNSIRPPIGVRHFVYTISISETELSPYHPAERLPRLPEIPLSPSSCTLISTSPPIGP